MPQYRLDELRPLAEQWRAQRETTKEETVVGMGEAVASSWFWDRGMSGVFGSVFSGLVTVAVLWLTLRHGTKQREDDALRADVLTLRSDYDRLTQRIMVGDPAAFMFMMDMPTNRVASTAYRRHRSLSEVVVGYSGLIATGLSSPAVNTTNSGFANAQLALNALSNAKNQLDGWLANPKQYRRDVSARTVKGQLQFVETGEWPEDPEPAKMPHPTRPPWGDPIRHR